MKTFRVEFDSEELVWVRYAASVEAENASDAKQKVKELIDEANSPMITYDCEVVTISEHIDDNDNYVLASNEAVEIPDSELLNTFIEMSIFDIATAGVSGLYSIVEEKLGIKIQEMNCVPILSQTPTHDKVTIKCTILKHSNN